jgi:hypothetical protein
MYNEFLQKDRTLFSNIGRKTGSGISHTFKKAGKNIARGLGSLAGGLEEQKSVVQSQVF